VGGEDSQVRDEGLFLVQLSFPIVLIDFLLQLLELWSEEFHEFREFLPVQDIRHRIVNVGEDLGREVLLEVVVSRLGALLDSQELIHAFLQLHSIDPFVL